MPEAGWVREGDGAWADDDGRRVVPEERSCGSGSMEQWQRDFGFEIKRRAGGVKALR